MGEASTFLEVLALCPERQGSFLRSDLLASLLFWKQRHSVNLVGLGRGLGTGEWGRFLLSPPGLSICEARPSAAAVLNSPFSVMESLVGLVGRCHFGPACCTVPSPGSSALIQSGVGRDPAARSVFLQHTKTGLYSGSMWASAVMLYQMTALINAFYQTAVHMMLPRQMERLYASFCTRVEPASPGPNGFVFLFPFSIVGFVTHHPLGP